MTRYWAIIRPHTPDTVYWALVESEQEAKKLEANILKQHEASEGGGQGRPPGRTGRKGKWSMLQNRITESEWRVVYHYGGHQEMHIVRRWKPIRALIRYAPPDVRYVDVGPRIGPYLVRFIIQHQHV